MAISFIVQMEAIFIPREIAPHVINKILKKKLKNKQQLGYQRHMVLTK